MTNLRVGVLALTLALSTAAAGCTAMTGRSAGRNIDDASITAAVKANLAADRASSLTSVDVDTVAGTVYLTGSVPTAATKQRATEIAREVDGVARVINNLQAKSAGDAPRD